MRVTTRGMQLRSFSHVQRARSRQDSALVQLSSGLKISRVSDDPVAANLIARSASTLARIESRVGRTNEIDSQLAHYDTTLGNATDIMRRLHELAVQMGNDTYIDDNRRSAAEEFQTLRDALLSVANAEMDGRSVFAGNATGAPAFDAAGVYQGDTAQREAEVGPGERIVVNVTGDEAFVGTGGGVNVFEMIDRTITALQANDAAAVRGEIGNYVDSIDQLSDIRSRIGGRLASVSQLRETNLDERVRESEVLAGFRDADLAQAATELTAAETGVQAALAVAGRIGQLSLLDLL